MAGWRFILADQTGTNIGEPRARQRTYTPGVSTVETAGFNIRADDPMWNSLDPDQTNLKVFDSAGNLRLYGPIVSDEEVGNGLGATVQVTAASIAWNLGKRFNNKDTTGVGTTYTTDPAQTITTTLNALNAEQPTGIVMGTVGTFTAQTVTFLWKKQLDALNELGGIYGSYEWAIRYVDGTPPTCYLDLLLELGTDRSQQVYLEYGYGTLANCSGYSRVRSKDTSATRVWALGNGSTSAGLASSPSDEVYVRYEDVVTYGDITNITLLNALAVANVAIRKRERTIINLTPFPQTAPLFGVNWFTGDLVAARVVVNNNVRVSGTSRIWGASIAIDELGNETATLQLVPQ